MKKRLHIAVIGSGTAGAAAALYLHEQGHQVCVFEREQEPKPVGAGIMLQATGLKLLDDFGLRQKALSLGTPIHAMLGENEHKKKVVDLSFENDEGLFGLGIHRGALYFMLFDEMNAQGIDVQLGKEIIRIDGDGSEQRTLYDKEGNEFTGFDLVVVANGSRSLLRKQFSNIVKKEVQPEYGALWVKIPHQNEVFDNRIHQFYEGSYKMMGFMPIGKPSEEDEEYVNFFWSIKLSEIERWKKEGLEAWKKEMIHLNASFADVIDKIESIEQVMIAPYMDAVLKPNFHENIVFIGDAAHPMSPQLSQGASFALLDARFLCDALANHESVEKALKSYYKNRSAQVNYYQNVSRIITPMFQSDRKRTWYRDLLFKLLCSIGIFKKILLGTILGYRKDVFNNLDDKYYKPTSHPQS